MAKKSNENELKRENLCLWQKLDYLQDKLDKTLKALENYKKYAWHKPHCRFFAPAAIALKEDCTCGYFDLIKGGE